MSHLLSVAKAQSIVDSFHPRICETRERFDGELYEREVYPHGPSPQISHTYLIYGEGIGDRYYAIAREAGLKKYSDNQVEFEVTTAGTPLAYTIIRFRQAACFHYSGTKWHILSEDGEKLRTPQECIQIERHYELKLATNNLKNRLVADASNLSRFPQLSGHRPDVQYATASCNYLSEDPSGDIEVLESLLQELLTFEANKLGPMCRRLDYERDKVEQQKHEEAAKALVLEQAKIKAEEARHVEQQRQKQIQIQREQELQASRRLQQVQVNKQREEAKQKQETIDKHAAQSSTWDRSLSAITYTAAVEELATLRRYQAGGAHKFTILPRANHLRQRCIISRERASSANPLTKSSTHQANGKNEVATVGAIIRAIAGLFVGGLPGAMAGAAIGGAFGAAEDGDKSPSSGTSAEPVESVLTDREKWMMFINEVDDLIHLL